MNKSLFTQTRKKNGDVEILLFYKFSKLMKREAHKKRYRYTELICKMPYLNFLELHNIAMQQLVKAFKMLLARAQFDP